MSGAEDLSLQQRNDAFRALLDTFNPAQRRAVEQVEGPVLVLAGPGAGKTHIIAARIGKILLETDARPQNILCLTFTDAGVLAMRQRLLQMIGPEAHRVPVFTFHAFCNRVIQENLEFFGRADLEPVTDLERIEIVRRLLDQLPPEHPLRENYKDAYQFEAHLRDLFALMKKEGWTPGFVRKKVREYADSLADNPDFVYQTNSKYGKKGDLKTSKIQAEQERMNRLAAAADLYAKYLNAMQRAGRYEYEDMILWVLRAFSRHEALLRAYQERYQYVLVDEYQDTNGAQNQLLQLLLDYWDVPNIFIVGDDDQSIYEFQGARLQNMLDFYRQYKDNLHTVVLEDNYRSTQSILDAAQKVIANNLLRAVRRFEPPIEKKLKARSLAALHPELFVYENRLQEEADISLQIEALLRAGEAASDIAVIYARHRQAMRLMTLLERKGVPYRTRRPVNILELPLIRQFRELLRYINDEINHPFSGEHRLFRLLHAPFFGLDPLTLAQTAIQIQKDGGAWRETPLVVALQNKDGGSWISDALLAPLPALIERLFVRTGLLAYVLSLPDKNWHLQTLHTLLSFAKAEAARAPQAYAGGNGKGLTRWLDLLDSMDDNRAALEAQQLVGPAEGVQLLTAHSSKGLEFKHVFMLDCTTEAWEPGARSGAGRFALPPTLTLSGEEDAMEARRRLFYVAMTRAKQHLRLSYALQNDEGKPLGRSRFADEAGISETPRAVPLETLVEAQTILMAEPGKPVVTLPENALLDDLLSNFALSVTNLNRFLRCPLAFYYEDILKIPEAMSEAAAFGQSMHGALQYFFLKWKADKKQQLPDAEALVKSFQTEMKRRQAYFSHNAFAQRAALGQNLLRRYHVEQIPYWRRRAVAERRIDRVTVDGAPLTGVIDKIEWLDSGVLRVIDYKTGSPDKSKAAPPSEAQPNGGEYWRQLAFYKILIEASHAYAEPVGPSVISWLETDKQGRFPNAEVHFSAEDIRFVKNLIAQTYQAIMERQFNEGCGKPDCSWCRLHHQRVISADWARAEEGLDDGEKG